MSFLPVVDRALARKAGVELRSPARIRRCFRNVLQVHSSPPNLCVGGYGILLGQRRATAYLLLGAPLVSAGSGCNLSHRVRVALGSSGRPCWQRRHVARQSVSAGSSRTNRTRRLRSVADALLV